MAKPIDLTGQRFGRWTVVRRTEKPSPYISFEGAWWLCKCDCGQERAVRGASLRFGSSVSCGCLNRERVTAANKRRALNVENSRSKHQKPGY